MEIHVYRDRDAIGQAAAAVFAAQVLAKPHSVLGLATGSTPLATYDALAQMCARGEVDFRHVCTFNLDEYIGLGRQDAQSYYRFMEENLFRKINIAPCNCHVPNGLAEDIDAECAAYDDAIERAGGIDLQFLGIGHDGHIGFNEPDESFSKGTHLAHLSRMTIEANRRFFASAEEVPRTAISMGIGSIMKPR